MSDEIVREYNVGKFRGNFPDVDIADGVDMESIKQRDATPMFVTLPIAEIGAVSNNGLLYDELLVESIAEQINAKRPGGIFGHLKDDDRSTSFPLPAGLWVGAKRVGQTLWAKSYITPGAARDYVQTLKDVGGEIATSIYGKGKFEKVRDGVRRLANFNLESLDFAPPGRAALGLGAIPYVTAEMNTEQEAEMPVDKAQVIAELTVGDIPATLRDAIVAEASKVSEDKATIAELTATKSAQETVIAELKQQLEAQRRREFEAALDATVAEFTAWETKSDAAKAKLGAVRTLFKDKILALLGEERAADNVAETAKAAWEELKPIAEMVRDVLAGPAAAVSGRVQEMGRPKLEDTPEARQAALGSFQISV